jgi:hypothetical protein
MSHEEDEFARRNIHDDLDELLDEQLVDSPTKKKVAFTETGGKIKMNLDV